MRSITRPSHGIGIGIILNILGEHYTDLSRAAQDTEEYCELIPRIQNAHACVSVKPSQLGADIGADVFRSHLEQIVETADEHDVFVWVDMEDSGSTELTIEAVESLADAYPQRLGVCLQANLKRTEQDLPRLNGGDVAVRLVKGAYDEPADIAYQSEEHVDEVFQTHMEYLFAEFEGRFALGTHDPAMIATAKELATEHEANFEFQMLRGVREDAQRELVEDYSVWQYAPYGRRWPSYVWRRVREGKNNWRFILRALLPGL